jgi:ATP-dependent Lon protease
MSFSPTLPVLSVPDVVVLPGMVVPVELDDAAQAVIDAARAGADGQLLLAPRLSDRYASHGAIAEIDQIGRLPGGARAAVLRAHARAKIGSGVSGPGAALWVEAEPVEDPEPSERARELGAEYKRLVIAILQRRNAWQVVDSVQRVTDPSELADLAGYASYLSLEQKRELLETPDVERRLHLVTEWARDHLAEVEVSEKIRDDVREGMDKAQREFLLRQQLAAIRKELGEDEAASADGADSYRSRVEAAQLPAKAHEAAMREVGKLERASDQSPEAGWIRTWLDTVLELPWNTRTTDNHDVAAAARSSTPTTTGWTTSRTASPNTSPCAPGGPNAASKSSADGARAPCSLWSGRPASARPRWGSRSPGRSDASSSAWLSAVSATRPRSAVTGARMSARCRAGSSGPSVRPVR